MFRPPIFWPFSGGFPSTLPCIISVACYMFRPPIFWPFSGRVSFNTSLYNQRSLLHVPATYCGHLQGGLFLIRNHHCVDINHLKVNLMFAIRFSSLLLSILESFLLPPFFLHFIVSTALHSSVAVYSQICTLLCLFPFHFCPTPCRCLFRLFHFNFHIFSHSLLSFPIFFFTQPTVLSGNPLRPDPVKSVLRTSVRKQATHTQGFAWVYSAALDE